MVHSRESQEYAPDNTPPNHYRPTIDSLSGIGFSEETDTR